MQEILPKKILNLWNYKRNSFDPIKDNNIDVSHFIAKGKRKKSKLELIHDKIVSAVAISQSISEAMRNVNIPIAGNNHKIFSLYVSDNKIDTSHFKIGVHVNRNVSTNNLFRIFTYDEILPKCSRIKKWLIDNGIKDYKCEYCKLTIWNNHEIPLQLHHIDGNRYNFMLDNLQILCPNCHYQTDNWGNKKR